MWDTIWSILVAVLMLGVMVWVHELGHFWVAKKTGIAVQTFSIGFGPALFKRTRKGVTYALRAFPLGGYVQFYDEEEGVPDPRAFNRAQPWRRLLTVLAGVAANLLLAILLATLFLTIYGEYAPTIGKVPADTPAAAAGIQAGDTITAVNGVQTPYNSQAYSEISLASLRGQTEVAVTWITADGKTMAATIPFYADAETGTQRIGIVFSPQRIHYNIGEAFLNSFGWVWYLLGQMLSVLGGLFTGATPGSSMVSAVGMVETMSMAARSGFESILRICTLLSINLGLVNLIPFPGLDGFRALTTGIEWVRKKPLSPKWENRINFVGLAVLLGLSVVLIGQDFLRLFTNGSALP